MKLWWRLAVAGLAVVWLSGFASVVRMSAQAQMTASPQGKKAGEYFKIGAPSQGSCLPAWRSQSI